MGSSFKYSDIEDTNLSKPTTRGAREKKLEIVKSQAAADPTTSPESPEIEKGEHEDRNRIPGQTQFNIKEKKKDITTTKLKVTSDGTVLEELPEYY